MHRQNISSSSSSSGRVDITEFLNPLSLSPFIPIIHHSSLIWVGPCVSTELMYISLCWLANTFPSMYRSR